MFTDMQDWTDIRRAVLVQGASKRAVCRQYGIAHKTLNKILAHSEPPGYRQSMPRPQTKLAPYLAIIEEILAADREAPAKQRHTAKRIFERLRDEHGYGGGITQVKEAVARLRRHSAEVFVPLAHSPGRAQFDFGEAAVTIAGKKCKAHFAVMSLPYSDAFFMCAYPRECTESFQDAHVSRVTFFGACPIVRLRQLQDRGGAHSGARARAPASSCACRPTFSLVIASAVWGAATRRATSSPGRLRTAQLHGTGAGLCQLGRATPTLSSAAGMTLFVSWASPESKAERLRRDRAAMLPLPGESFEVRRIAHAGQLALAGALRYKRLLGTGGLGPRRNHRQGWHRGGAHHRTRPAGLCRCPHLGAPAGELRSAPLPGPAGAQAPGAFDSARPLAEHGALPDCFALLRRRLERPSLRLSRHPRVHQGAAPAGDAARLPADQGGDDGRRDGTTSSDAIALIVAQRAERAVTLFALDGRPHLQAFALEPPDLAAYAALKAQGAAS